MALLKRLFPYSFQARSPGQLMITLLLYLIAVTLCGMVIRFFGSVPLVGVFFSLAGWALGVYFILGIIAAILCFLGVFKGSTD